MANGNEIGTLTFEQRIDPDFATEIASTPGGEDLFRCIQCGNCGGLCPLSGQMDYTPRKIIGMARAGFKDEVLQSKTIWLCSSCYSCTVECPKGIKITELMYTLKQRATEEKMYPKRFPAAAMPREFFSLVNRWGRSTESWLITFLHLKTNPLNLIKQGGLGLRLLLKGRMPLSPLPEMIKHRRQLQDLLNAVEREEKAHENKSPDETE